MINKYVYIEKRFIYSSACMYIWIRFDDPRNFYLFSVKTNVIENFVFHFILYITNIYGIPLTWALILLCIYTVNSTLLRPNQYFSIFFFVFYVCFILLMIFICILGWMIYFLNLFCFLEEFGLFGKYTYC